MIRDRLVVGIRDHRLKEKMLRDPGLTLYTAITICKAAETVERQIKVLTSTDSETVNYVNRSKQQSIARAGRPEKASLPRDSTRDATKPHDGGPDRVCGRCRTKHPPRRCPAYRFRCAKWPQHKSVKNKNQHGQRRAGRRPRD